MLRGRRSGNISLTQVGSLPRLNGTLPRALAKDSSSAPPIPPFFRNSSTRLRSLSSFFRFMLSNMIASSKNMCQYISVEKMGRMNRSRWNLYIMKVLTLKPCDYFMAYSTSGPWRRGPQMPPGPAGRLRAWAQNPGPRRPAPGPGPGRRRR